MAIAAPSDEVTRLVEALGLRTKNTREVTLRMAVNEAVVVNTVEYVNGEQIDALAAELKERQHRLVRWIPVEERLPEDNVAVLVWHDPGGVEMAFRQGSQWCISWTNHWHSGSAYTHWMPPPGQPAK
jgi:hypothetical protein